MEGDGLNVFQSTPPKHLGRQWYPDDRDQNFKIDPIPSAINPDRGWRHWSQIGWWGNQGYEPWCVAYSTLHYIADGPLKWANNNPAMDPRTLYCESQKLDPWFGDCDNWGYDGTTIRSAAKVLKREGIIREYRWAFTFEDVIITLASQGPLVLGTSWYSGMSWPHSIGDHRGKSYVEPEGRYEGGHAYVLNGVDFGRDMVRLKNSWGQDWGDDGHAWLSFDGLRKLMSEEWAEACQLR